ncbi:phosphoadenosine phosphosulfate reductase [Thraustotheca clavata]|uniref:Phosphoadenosine phosphosulfate reductase n=1 Tax=Thraustotheca clavata TaxID=74557 RepID=A0A1V9Y7S8_9STRA|nr:phosphoadenosine phosphosulfate reductase [Thraustotheca clavata]
MKTLAMNEICDNQLDGGIEGFVAHVNASLRGRTASEIVAWACDTFGPSIVLSSSFGVQSAVMLHLVTKQMPNVPVVWIDTGYLFPETYEFAQELRGKFQLNLQIYQSVLSPAHMEALYGKLWEQGTVDAHRLYGQLRKVEPMERALKQLNAKALLVGLRAEQTSHRKNLDIVHVHNGRLKICPILHWTAQDVDKYMEKHNLPYHPLKAKGYESIGDVHSSRPIAPNELVRITRFHGIAQECGLHMNWTDPVHEIEPLDISTIVIYSKPDCRYCIQAKEILQQKNLEFKEYIVDQDISTGQICERIGQVVHTVPQIFMYGEYIGGCTELKKYLA